MSGSFALVHPAAPGPGFAKWSASRTLCWLKPMLGNASKNLLILCSLWLLLATEAVAAGKHFLVLGVIASVDENQGVALMKDLDGGEAFAARVGQEIARDVKIFRITREYVYLQVNGRLDKVKVGEQLDTGRSSASGLAVDDSAGGVERSGNTVRVSAAFREHMVKEELSKVLMQAAAVPYYVNGALAGFRLWDIDPGSIYEKTGFQNGDIVTSINGQELTDVGRTIGMLQSLKNEARVSITFTRGGAPQTIEISVQ